MSRFHYRDDGLSEPAVTIRVCQLPATVCVAGGAACPLMAEARAREVLARVSADATAAIRLVSPAEELFHYTECRREDLLHPNPAEVFNRKRDLDVLQRLGLVPGSVRRARYLYELLFERIETLDGLCAYDTTQWEGCPVAREGVYKGVREQGWQAIVGHRTDAEMAAYRERNVEAIRTGGRLYIRPHHLMCFACGYAGGENDAPRPNDTLFELFERIRNEPDVPVTLVEGCCMACDCCDGFDPATGRCVHAGGLIRDYKKDLDVFQKLGLMPGATMPARELIALIFERIPSTRDVCGYGDGVLTSHEWAICSDGDGNAGYAKTRKTGVFGKGE